MGFLDRLKGGGDITLSVAADPAEPAPGQEVALRFDVGGELDDKCRGVRVGITGTGKYKVEERDRDSNGNLRTREVWRDVELHEEEHLYPAQIGPGQARLTLPADAPPSAFEAVEWEAFARVDRERGMDKVERVPLPVRQSADRLPTERMPSTSDDGLTLDEVPVAVRAGDQLAGVLTVAVADDVKVTAVRIRLHRTTTFVADRIDDYDVFRGSLLSSFVFGGGSSHITDREQVAEVDLAGKREFAPGQVERMPFAIAVPSHLGGTTGHPYARVEWRVEAVLDRRMRGDLSVDVPVVVF